MRVLFAFLDDLGIGISPVMHQNLWQGEIFQDYT
jgi:hypothetical protein